MTFQKKLYSLCFIFTILACTLSCASTPEKRVPLTDAEKDAITAHIRNFISKSKKMRLSKTELQIIKTQKPKYSIHYTGYKKGLMSIRWQLPAYRSLILQRSGNFMENGKSDWTARLIRDNTSGKIPSYFFGANGEDISLPQGKGF